MGGGHGRRGRAALHIPPQILPPSASRGTPAPRAGQCSASTRAGWGGIRVEKGPGHVQGTREGSKSPPLRCLERGHARCSQQEQKSQDIPAESQDIPGEKPGYIRRKAGIYQQKAGIYQQKSRDAAAEKPRCSNSEVTPHQKEKEQFQRGLQVQVFLPSSQQGILEEFWDYFRARAHHRAPHSSLQAWKAQIPTGNSCEQGKAAQPGC